MGRIAEALKRAQQERQQQLSAHPLPDWQRSGISFKADESRSNDFVRSHAAATTLNIPTSLSQSPSLQAVGSTVAPIPVDHIGPDVVMLHDANCEIAEKYRSVRTRLITANPGGNSRIYAVTSILPHEGRTTTTANLGFCLAELRHVRVAMIDLDFRQCGLSAACQANDAPGIAEVLRGEKTLSQICTPVVRNNLHLIPAGQLGTDSPSDLLAGDRLSRLFREINERFHYAFVDTPAIHKVADMGLIGPLCHSILMVIRMNRTPEPLLRRCVKMLQANQLTIAGCILAGYEEHAMLAGDGQEYGANGDG